MTLSVRLEPDVEQAFETEVKRRNTTKSQFVNQLLREALKPADPMRLLMEIRGQFGLPVPQAGTRRTDRSANTRDNAKTVVRNKHRASRTR
jgi:hypothetical protein